MAAKIPRWETELWSYISSGDGENCPFCNGCPIKLRGKWCPDEHKLRIAQLLDDEQFDLTDYDFIECGTCGGIIGLVEMLAERYLKENGIDCLPVPTELALKIEDENPVEVRMVPLRVHHGAMWCLKDGTVIQIRDDDPPAEKRLTLFHELFHVLARQKTTPVFRKTGARRGSFNELLANSFAGFMLMPQGWMKEKWAEVKDLDKMAEIFDVPKSTMCVRLKYLGFI